MRGEHRDGFTLRKSARRSRGGMLPLPPGGVITSECRRFAVFPKMREYTGVKEIGR